jgi:very-short-patch-repair endonuclease
MTPNEEDEQIGRKRVEKILRYLHALNEHRNPAKRNIEDQLWHLRISSLPDHPSIRIGTLASSESGTTTESSTQDGDFVLKVSRPRLTDCPKPPVVLHPWLERGWEEPSGSVRVRPTRPDLDKDGHTIVIAFADDTKAVQALAEWNRQRSAWITAESPARAAMAVFEQLYGIRGQVEREGESVELVLGDGILSWKRIDGSVYHPILLQRVQLEFDPTLPEFSLVEADSPVELYGSVFQSMIDVDGKAIARLRLELEQGKYHPLGKDDTSGFLRSLSSQLSPHGDFNPHEAPRPSGDSPLVGRSPMIFLRRRTLGFAVSLDAAIGAVTSGAAIPKSLLRIAGIETISEPPGAAESSRRWLDDIQPVDVLLSKPANPEQITIAQRLAAHGSVLVQGPPGTGKTHTIANLIGHLLAAGKSVLVTSHSTKALRVLRNHVVSELKPLCVSILDSDMESRKQLESSVDSIVSRLSRNDAAQLERVASDLQASRKALIDRYQSLADELLRARSDEFRDIVVAGDQISPSAAARFIFQTRDELSFIPHPVDLGAALPLSASELHDLYQTNILVSSEDEKDLGGGLPPLKELPTPSSFRSILAQRQAALDAHFVPREDLWILTRPELGSLEAFLDESRVIVSQIQKAFPWQLEAMAAGWQGPEQAKPWETLLSQIDEAWRFRTASADALLTHNPVLPSEWSADDAERVAEELWVHTDTGGGLSFVTLFTRSSWKRFILESSTSTGRPKLPVHFEALHQAARLKRLRLRLISRWEKQVVPLGGSEIGDLGEEPEVACWQLSEMINRSLSWFRDEGRRFHDQAESVGFNLNKLIDEQPPVLAPGGQLKRLAAALDGPFKEAVAARITRLQLAQAEKTLSQVLDLLTVSCQDEQATRVTNSLQRAVKLLNPDLYGEAFERLQDLYRRRQHLVRRRELLDRLQIFAPGWASAITARIGVHGSPDAPQNVDRAWRWRQLNDELDRRSNVSLRDLQDQVATIERSIKATTAELIENKAWAAQLRRTEKNLRQKQALVGWLDTVKKMGKGTGIRVPKLKAEANRLMSQCREAVPVWIMPLSRVADNFDPREVRFDVVIVDEASQTDVMGIMALYMADSAVVVGDHEQVSPSAVGQDLGSVQKLIDQYLESASVPNSHLYDGQTSIYDLARQSFGGAVRLVEHFRCVPEIIQFSNHLSYEGAIQPLRDSSNVALKPHVIAHRVNGARSDNKVNDEEANEVASLIMAATQQPEYAGKSFGVVSMVGEDQAFRIDAILRKHLTEEDFKLEHNILCGTPSQFQGDERDVMFLSMVDVSHGEVLRMREEQMFKQRYNVAASRARDQMWVVHSLDPKSHLKPGDLRRRLIEYAEDPESTIRAMRGIEHEVESQFELDVASRLIRLGFRVVPQWRVGYYRIDLVVQGEKSNLAVECDGDRYHPIAKLPDDMARQAVLERLGWTFVRLRGSEYFRNPERTMEPLLNKLASMGIEPMGHESTESSAVVSTAAGNELRDRVIRRAQEIRAEWRQKGPESAHQNEKSASPVETRNLLPYWRKVVPESPPEHITVKPEVEGISVLGRQIDHDTQEEDEPFYLTGGPKLSKNVAADELRKAIHSSVPDSGRIEREILIRKTAAALGFSRLSKPLRSRINKAIGAESRVGRLSRDAEWNQVWRHDT